MEYPTFREAIILYKKYLKVPPLKSRKGGNIRDIYEVGIHMK